MTRCSLYNNRNKQPRSGRKQGTMKTLLKSKILSFSPCPDQANLLDETFPGERIRLTLANCQKAVRAGLYLDWLAERLFPAPLLADYAAKRSPLLADYEAKRSPLWADYTAKCTPLLADYAAQRATLWADYKTKCAPLFFACLQKLGD